VFGTRGYVLSIVSAGSMTSTSQYLLHHAGSMISRLPVAGISSNDFAHDGIIAHIVRKSRRGDMGKTKPILFLVF
jgi:hypothetical protein